MIKKPQQGIALMVVMIVLVIMLTGALSILRNTNVGLGIAGNLGFKQNATSVSDQGVEAARAWLLAQPPANLFVAQTAQAYFETMTPGFNPDTYAWAVAGNSVISTVNDGTGNQVRYVIHRMCLLTGSPSFAGQECVRPTASANGSRQLGGGGVGIRAPATPLYRVTVHTDGPRNTMSHIQVMIY